MARLVAVIAAVAAQESLTDDSSGLIQSKGKVKGRGGHKSTNQLNLEQLVEEPNKRRFCHNRVQFHRAVGVARICKPGYDPIGEGCYEHCPPGWLSGQTDRCVEPCALRNTNDITCIDHICITPADDIGTTPAGITPACNTGLYCDCWYNEGDTRQDTWDSYPSFSAVNYRARHGGSIDDVDVTDCPQSTEFFEDDPVGLCFDPPPANCHCIGIICYRDCDNWGNNEQPFGFCEHPNEASDGMDLHDGWGDALNELPQEVQEMVWSSSAINYEDVQECADMCMTNPLCVGFVAMDEFQDEPKRCVFKAHLQCAQAD